MRQALDKRTVQTASHVCSSVDVTNLQPAERVVAMAFTGNPGYWGPMAELSGTEAHLLRDLTRLTNLSFELNEYDYEDLLMSDSDDWLLDSDEDACPVQIS